MSIQLTDALGTRWSVLVQDLDSDEMLFSHEPDQVLSTASIGKLFLLHRLLTEVDSGERSLDEKVARQPIDFMDESGLWHLLQQNEFSLYDIATLIGAFSDNAATNTLVRVIGIEKVRQHAKDLGYERSGLNDLIRWPIPPGYPERLSQGNATELVRFVSRLVQGKDLSPSSTDIFQRWLGAGADLSMVAAPYNLDPLAHYAYDRDIWFWNKTGTLLSVRADVGLVMSRHKRVAFAAIAQWNRGEDARDPVLANMAEIGELIRDYLVAV